MINWYYIVIGIVILAFVFLIRSAVRKTKDKIAAKMGPAPSELSMKKKIEEIRQRDIRCPRCGKQAFALLETDTGYKCPSCNHVFESVPHI